MRGVRAWGRTAVGAVAILAFGLATPAWGSEYAIAVGAPDRVAVGDEVEIKVVVTEDGEPVDGAELQISVAAGTVGTSGRIVLTTATTDAQGVAVMRYVQRMDTSPDLWVEYVGPNEEASVEPYVLSMAVDPGDQLYQNRSGVEIPFVNGGLFILVVLMVWVMIALAATYLVRVGLVRQPPGVDSPKTEGGQSPVTGLEAGSIWISALLAAAAIVTAAGMVVVVVRAPVSNADVTDPSTYSRTPIAFLDADLPYLGVGLTPAARQLADDPVADGSHRFVGYGCASCHGIGASGATVGPDLVGEIGSFGRFANDVREGPKGMPSYGVDALPEADLTLIHAYLTSLESNG